MNVIDKIDKRIIMALTENCRYPNSLIAKQLKISEQLVACILNASAKLSTTNFPLISPSKRVRI
ncbi:MAG: AsnC family protein [Nanoarchaeota archaeon]|nr:AsnC family protein [Nanoarchaeota archaeon]